MNTQKTGILLINLGTPAAPNRKAIKKYLAEFLSDPEIVTLPRILWLPFLHGFLLNIYPRKKVEAYKKIWTSEGSPLFVNTQKQQQKLQAFLDPEKKYHIVKFAMRYGEPSIPKILKEFKDQNIKRIITLPMFPQYSTSIYKSIFAMIDPLANIIKDYHEHPAYIRALTNSVREHWLHHKKNFLLFSFHGIPEKFIAKGDPYQDQCIITANLVAKELELEPHQWSYAFQSRFGKEAWIKPYTTEILKTLPSVGIKNVTLMCPGFAADCLETLEEINIINREDFLKAGGELFDYIPALNDRDDHIHMMEKLINQFPA